MHFLALRTSSCSNFFIVVVEVNIVLFCSVEAALNLFLRLLLVRFSVTLRSILGDCIYKFVDGISSIALLFFVTLLIIKDCKY